jgi:hypothetical protein
MAARTCCLAARAIAVRSFLAATASAVRRPWTKAPFLSPHGAPMVMPSPPGALARPLQVTEAKPLGRLHNRRGGRNSDVRRWCLCCGFRIVALAVLGAVAAVGEHRPHLARSASIASGPVGMAGRFHRLPRRLRGLHTPDSERLDSRHLLSRKVSLVLRDLAGGVAEQIDAGGTRRKRFQILRTRCVCAHSRQRFFGRQSFQRVDVNVNPPTLSGRCSCQRSATKAAGKSSHSLAMPRLARAMAFLLLALLIRALLKINAWRACRSVRRRLPV